ncbi:MAG: sterol desaturase family protein [Ilumatobacteraceae bacterium]
MHAPEDAWTSRRLGTGSGHRQHHLDPPAVEWLLLRGVDAAVFAMLIAIGTAAWALPFAALFGVAVSGQGLLAAYLTALLAALLALGHYEWTHLLVHTPYRARTRYYRRLARNHRRHHYRNEDYWLGVTSNLGDRIMRTYPADKSDVPLSDTARTLS